MQSDTYTCPFSSSLTDRRDIFDHACNGGNGAAGTIPGATIPPTYGDTMLQLPDYTDMMPRYNLGSLTVG